MAAKCSICHSCKDPIVEITPGPQPDLHLALATCTECRHTAAPVTEGSHDTLTEVYGHALRNWDRDNAHN